MYVWLKYVLLLYLLYAWRFFLKKKKEENNRHRKPYATGTARATSDRSSTMETTAKHFDILIALTEVVPMHPACYSSTSYMRRHVVFFFTLFFDHPMLSMQERYMCTSTHVLYSLCFNFYLKQQKKKKKIIKKINKYSKRLSGNTF